MAASSSRSPCDATVTTGSPAATPLSQVHDLLLSLLHWWPYGPHEQCPSLLLCGPAANGKSHLMRRVVHDANTHALQNPTQPELAAHEQQRQVLAVVPPLAAAVAAQQANDGCTGLRRLLRREIEHACRGVLSTATTASAFAVLLVLDHMECYITHDDAFVSGESEAAAARSGGDAAASSSSSHQMDLNTSYAALFADLYTVLRCSPPLFSAAESAALHLSTLVCVCLFTGEVDAVHPVVRHRYVDYALSLPTPTEAERRTFFHAYASPSGDAVAARQRRIPAALVERLVLRTGGVSYGGLQEIIELALDDEVEPGVASLLDAVSCGEDRLVATAAAVAQRLVHAYQSSGSVTAHDYRRSAGYVDVQVTRWEDIAGMAEVKATLRRLVTDPIRHRDAYRSFHVRPSTGVLLYGPPGTGKTMLAKAMATELNASFIYMDLPELVQSEVGESERRLQAYFDVARERSPSLVFMDEVQAAFGLRYAGASPSAGKAQCGGASNNNTTSTSHDARLISHLLRLLDAAQQDEDHFVLFVGATNVVHLLDPLLLRAGRLDTLLEVPLPERAARESLVRRVVYGEWAAWFTGDDEGSEHTATTLDAVQDALVIEFVGLSEGFSGAQVRNLLSVFSLQLARTVSRNNTQAGDGKDAYGSLSDRVGAVQRQRRLRDGIKRFLVSEESKEVLSAAALKLVKESHAKSCM